MKHVWLSLIALVAVLVTGCAPTNPPITEPTLDPVNRGAQVQPSSSTERQVGGLLNPVGAVTGPTLGPVDRATALIPTPTDSAAPLKIVDGPTATFGPIVAQPSATPTLTSLPPSPAATLPIEGSPQPTFGPVIGRNYTPPPTFTPIPAVIPGGTLPPIYTPGPSSTPGPTLRSDLMGVQIHGFLSDADFAVALDRAQELGVKWVKFQIDWSLLEPTKGQFDTRYQGRVLAIQRASVRGFKTMLSFAKAPDWARPESVRGNQAGPSDDPQAMVNFISRFVRDTKPEFIDAIEVWNEANLVREWNGKALNGGTYMQYFRAVYQSLLDEQRLQPSTLKPDHRIVVITAGPAPTITVDGQTVNDRDWIQQLYDNGLASFGPDVVVGVHPYGWANAPDAKCCTAGAGITGWYEHPSFYFRETLDAYRQIMIKNNHQTGKLWVTEFGWASFEGLTRSDGSPAQPTSDNKWQALLNQAQQADYVLRAFTLAQQPPYFDYLGPMILWNLNVATFQAFIDTNADGVGFSLLDNKGQPRAAFLAIKNAQKTK